MLRKEENILGEECTQTLGKLQGFVGTFCFYGYCFLLTNCFLFLFSVLKWFVMAGGLNGKSCLGKSQKELRAGEKLEFSFAGQRGCQKLSRTL